jgi:para-nitrobenzyl esterase
MRDATAFGAPCTQPILGDWNRLDANRSREDCLYLNVVTPEWPVSKPLPVMVWIHGGFNLGGSGGGSLYNRGTLAGHGVVVVTINYRLGVFGFLSLPALSRESAHRTSGNYALMDQILALRWVRRNIARFGGDPENVTVFGQSAGAIDIALLMASPRARGLFQKVIEESGPIYLPPLLPPVLPLAAAEHVGLQLAEKLDSPPDAAGLALLRRIPARTLISRIASIPAPVLPQPRPDLDGWVLEQPPAEVFAAGKESPVPLLFGTTTREFGAPPMSLAELRPMLSQWSGPLSTQVLAVYGLSPGAPQVDDPRYGSGPQQLGADFAFRCPAVLEAKWHIAARHPVYEYELDHAIPGQPFAVHSSELPYVFGYFPKAGNIAGPFTAVDRRLADLIQTYWTNFARTGNPNSTGVPEWPEFGREGRYIQFLQNGDVAVAHHIRRAQCRLYREVVLTHQSPGRQALSAD